MAQPTYEELTDLVTRQAAIIGQQQGKIDALTEKLEIMHHRVSQMSRRIFANTSERYDDPNQQVLPFMSSMAEVVANLAGEDNDDDDDDPPRGGGSKVKKRKNRGRLKIPDTIDVVEKRIEPLPEQRTDAEERILPQIGVEVSEQLDYRAGGWVKLRIERPVLEGPVLNTDDTPIPLLDSGRGRTATGRMWIYRTTEDALFQFTRTRAGAEPQDFLADYHGTVVADAYPGYDAPFDAGRAQEAACWAYTRRYFFEAAVGGDDGGEWAATAYGLIGSCRIADVTARIYLAAITDELLNRPEVDPAALTPRQWAESQRSQVA